MANEENIEQLLLAFTEKVLRYSNPFMAMQTSQAKRLIEIGEPVVAHIFSNTVIWSVHLAELLEKLTDAKPVSEIHRDDLAAVQASWQAWATENGY